MENVPESLIKAIIKEQSLIIGESLAISRAEVTGTVSFTSNKIEGLHINENNPTFAIEKLINSYKEVFGQASVEVCISVIKKYPKDEVQSFLPEAIKVEI